LVNFFLGVYNLIWHQWMITFLMSIFYCYNAFIC
jgi:NADH:ubiquinone oxidoreductase subunit K